MASYLIKLLVLIVFSFVVLTTYYSSNIHIESFTWYFFYFFIVSVLYLLYKLYLFYINKKSISLTAYNIFSLFLTNLFILSLTFFSLNDLNLINWFILFFSIVIYLFLPFIITITSMSFWHKILSNISIFKDQSNIFQFISSTTFWLVIFITWLSILWFFGQYNFYSVLFIIWIFLVFSAEVLYINLTSVFTKKIIQLDSNLFFITEEASNEWEISKSQKTAYLLSTEFLFFILTFLISINFINIVRPMPIGWDDLWVYMNFPQQMALSWTNMMYWWMNAWQTLTGIWFMLKSNVQAFFFNNLGGILSTIFLILITSDLLKSTRKTFINIPLLIATIFMAMPMVIFQQAKDMKLDIWLFAFSIAWIYMFYYIFSKYIWSSDESDFSSDDIIINYDKKIETWDKDLFRDKWYLILFFIIWIIIWFTFSIKVTSLITISALIWVIFYSKLWISWLSWYLALFVAIFTKWHLWWKLNVVYPSADTVFINNVFYIWIIISVIFFTISFVKFKQNAFIKTFILLFVFLFWIISILSPWFIKNLYQAGWEFWINNLISWKSDRINIDYWLIYSQSELEGIKDKHTKLWLDETWTTNHEDLWRYFGYEKWINNYVKLPWNLTMQLNQSWEYTDITYIYLALIPVIFLFLSYSNKFFAVWNLFIISWISIYFIFWKTWLYLTDILSKITLPWWYVIILWLFLLPTFYYLLTLNKSKLSILFKINLVFTFFYTFLWSISAFWIVWYWISMYFGFLLMIAIWFFYISYYDENEDNKNNIVRLFWSVVIFFIISIYFLNSSIPHWFNNLKNSSYANFKSWLETQGIWIFNAHINYLPVLSELNLNDDKWKLFKNIIIKYDTSDNSIILKILEWNNIDFSDIWIINNLLLEIYKVPKDQLPIKYNDLDIIRDNLFKSILYPPVEYKNTKWIYRIWTFLKYFTSENYNRFYEDNLVNNFDKYIYSNNSDITVNRMKELWLNYFLVDLNAATIDKDPRHDLTRRYELLLDTFKSNQLELVQTDSLCLRLWIEQYNIDWDFSKYMAFAWVNYDSYITDDKWIESSISRRNKQFVCYSEIINLINSNEINDQKYNYLLEINNYIKYQKSIWKLEDENEIMWLLQKYVNHWWFVLFKIK